MYVQDYGIERLNVLTFFTDPTLSGPLYRRSPS